MGYFGGATTFVTGKYIGVGSDQFSYDYVACTGSEVKLSDCFYKQNVTCSSGEGIYIYCEPNSPNGKATLSFDNFIGRFIFYLQDTGEES